jgi:micrococcal nuclease
MYEYKAKLVRVVDGDTIDLDIDLGLSVHRMERVRVFGVDTPEMTSSDLAQRARAQTAKSYVEGQLAGAELVVVTEKPDPKDKYGRFLAKIRYRLGGAAWSDLTTKLVEEGLAVPYFGGTK